MASCRVCKILLSHHRCKICPPCRAKARADYEAGDTSGEIARRIGVSYAAVALWRSSEGWNYEAHLISRRSRKYGPFREAFETGMSWPDLCASAQASESGLMSVARALGWNLAAREEVLKVIRRDGHDSVTLARLRSKTHKHARRTAARGDVSNRFLARLLADSPLCAYCGEPITEDNRSFDHIDPVSRGGEHSITNLVVCCQACNSSKRDRPLLAWLASRRAA